MGLALEDSSAAVVVVAAVAVVVAAVAVALASFYPSTVYFLRILGPRREC